MLGTSIPTEGKMAPPPTQESARQNRTNEKDLFYKFKLHRGMKFLNF